MLIHKWAAAAFFGFVAMLGSAHAGSNGADWSGAYIGADLGYGTGVTTPSYRSTSQYVDFTGLLGGLKAGYQVQSNRTVVGVEVDASIANLNGSYDNSVGFNPPCTTRGEGCTASVNWLTSARARIGVAGETFMPYITAGVAMGGVKGSFDTGACTCFVDSQAFGIVAGAGAEIKISDKVSTNAEVLLYDLGHPSLTSITNGGVSTGDYKFAVARIGVSYHF